MFCRSINSLVFLLLLTVSPLSSSAAANLSVDEKSWIVSNPTIRVANEMDWPPFDFVDEHGHARGFSIDYMELIASKVGLNVEWVNGHSWQDLLALGQSREIDVFPAIIFNEDRAQYLDFSEPYLDNVVGYFVGQATTPIEIRDPKELGRYRLALVKGFDNERAILNILPDVSRVEVDSALEGLKAVMTGEADIYIEDTAVGNYLIKKHLLRGVHVSGGVKLPELFETTKIRIATRNDVPQLNSIISKGMEAISESEMQALRDRWLELPPQKLLTGERIVTFVVSAVALTLMLAIFSIWGLRRQRNRLVGEMRRQTRALNESERRLALALQGGGMAAWDVDLRTGAMVLSSGWWEMLGMEQSNDQAPRDTWLGCIHVDDRQRVVDAETSYRQGELNRYEVEFRVQPDDGSTRWHVAIGAGVDTDASGRPARMVGVIQDITERKRFEQLKDEFVSSVSHELRTPLTSIKGSLGLLLGGALKLDSEEALRMLNIANNNCDRLLLLVRDLLDMDKIQAGRLELLKAPVLLHALCESAVVANQGYAAKYNVTLSCDLSKLPELTLIADEQRLLQILSNLISNAIKFSPSGETVSLAAAAANDSVTLSVTDHGPGVPEGFKNDLFKPFCQADGSNTGKHGGTGLGLSISKRLIELHDGTIGFNSVPGKGAVFYVSLPVESVREESDVPTLTEEQ